MLKPGDQILQCNIDCRDRDDKLTIIPAKYIQKIRETITPQNIVIIEKLFGVNAYDLIIQLDLPPDNIALRLLIQKSRCSLNPAQLEMIINKYPDIYRMEKLELTWNGQELTEESVLKLIQFRRCRILTKTYQIDSDYDK